MKDRLDPTISHSVNKIVEVDRKVQGIPEFSWDATDTLRNKLKTQKPGIVWRCEGVEEIKNAEEELLKFESAKSVCWNAITAVMEGFSHTKTQGTESLFQNL